MGHMVWNTGRRQSCLSFREYGGCRDGDQCEMKHITPDKECENDEYKKHGFCDNYWNCECSHPWDESRGDKHVKYREWMRERSKHKQAASEQDAAQHEEHTIDPEDHELRGHGELYIQVSTVIQDCGSS